MAAQYVFDLGDPRCPSSIGTKAEHLRFLMSKGFQAPATFVCSWDAYLRYRDGDSDVVSDVKAELLAKLDLTRHYAVRSSANVEDTFDRSFAGQFLTILNVHGADGLVDAIESVWRSTQAPGVRAYLAKSDVEPDRLSMAVIVQQMVPAAVSGVAFSKNPMTGMDEIVVEAVRGSGELLVQEGVTPARWVNKWGAWILESEEEGISTDLIQRVVDRTKGAAAAFGAPVDLEWVYDGQELYWVQMRPITAIEGLDFYSNHLSKEFFPGMIKPLIWSVNVPLVNSGWVRFLTELIGPNDLDPYSLARSFYYRAYFNMGALGQVMEKMGLPRETLELLAGIELGGPERPSFKPSRKVVAYLPRMLWVVIDKLLVGSKVEAFLRTTKPRYDALPMDRVGMLSEEELLSEIDRLYALTQESAYYNIVIPMLTQVLTAVLKSSLERAGVDYESLATKPDIRGQEYDPNEHLARLNSLYRQLDQELQVEIARQSYDEFRQFPGVDELRAGVEAFLQRFGHFSDSTNDFSVVPWRENPSLVLKMVINYTPPEAKAQARLRLEDTKLSPLRKLFLRWLLGRTQRLQQYRGAVGFLYAYGYGLFRVFFLALGERFARRGVIDASDDIFYLDFPQVRRVVADEQSQAGFRQRVSEVKRQIEAYRDVVPPAIVYGDQEIPLPAQMGGTLRGTPTSRGHYSGPVKVISGIQEFDKMQEGDVLVIPFSDVGWTPLFTRAGAVIAESGGILSHSSIIAREYGIPAVVSVPGACNLADDTLVTVDGYRGEIIVHESDQGDSPSPAEARR